jgi:hypothetical protein
MWHNDELLALLAIMPRNEKGTLWAQLPGGHVVSVFPSRLGGGYSWCIDDHEGKPLFSRGCFACEDEALADLYEQLTSREEDGQEGDD